MTETPRHAEREVERARADLSHTLDALRERLTIGHLVDEARTQFFGSSGGEFTTNLSRQLRENPMPAALIGLGVLWMMMSERGGRARTHAVRVHPSGVGRETGYPEAGGEPGYLEGVGERAQQAAAQMGMGLRSTTETMRGAGEGATERARHAAAGAGETMRSMAGTVSETMRHAGDSASGWMEQARGAARSAGGGADQMRQRTMQSLNTLVEEQPLVLGAVGMALGAIVGAMLPSTRIEDQYLGETRDQLRDAVAEQGGELYERGKATATEVYRAAAEEARTQGLVPEETGGKPLAEKAEGVLRKAGEAAREAGQREAGAASESGGTTAQQAAREPGRQPPESIKPGSPVTSDRPPAPPVRES